MRTRSVLSYLPALLVLSAAAFAQTTAFTYQGRLTDGVSAGNGTYEMQFSLYDAVSGPTQIGTTITNNNVPVTNGIFTVQLDFAVPNAFDGTPRWLEIAVRKANDPPGFTILTPRQPITSSPYAIQTLNASQLGGVAANQYVQTNDSRLTDARTPTAHAGSHQNGGSDEIAVTTPAANQIPKADASGKLATGWLNVGTTANTVAAGNDSRFVGVTAANYLFSYDTTNQSIVTANTFQDVTFSNNSQISGWTHVNGSSLFICAQNGSYLIEYAWRVSTVAVSQTASLRATLNGIEIAGSQSSIDLTTVNSVSSVSTTIIVNAFAGDVLRFQFGASGFGPSLRANAGLGTTRPSISTTIIRNQ